MFNKNRLLVIILGGLFSTCTVSLAQTQEETAPKTSKERDKTEETMIECSVTTPGIGQVAVTHLQAGHTYNVGYHCDDAPAQHLDGEIAVNTDHTFKGSIDCPLGVSNVTFFVDSYGQIVESEIVSQITTSVDQDRNCQDPQQDCQRVATCEVRVE